MATASKVKGSAPKVRNSNRTKGYWLSLHNARNNKDRSLASRHPHTGINFPGLGEVGSAAYRRLRKVR